MVLCGYHSYVHARVCQIRRAEFQRHQRAPDQCHLCADDVYHLSTTSRASMARPMGFTTSPTISGGGTRLFCPNYTASDGTKQKCYWSRGNGWVFVALARMMEVLPANDPHYAEYLQTFQEMAAALKAVQRADGFWNVNLGYANDFPGPESSGTACFLLMDCLGNQSRLSRHKHLFAGRRRRLECAGGGRAAPQRGGGQRLSRIRAGQRLLSDKQLLLHEHA